MVLDQVEVGTGNYFRPEGGQKIVWVRFDVKGSGTLTADLTSVQLIASGTSYPVQGVGFGGIDPSVQHLIDPNIQQSGTVSTSGPAIGQIVYDTGAKQVTFQTLPSRMSLIFVVKGPYEQMEIGGLPGGKIKVK